MHRFLKMSYLCCCSKPDKVEPALSDNKKNSMKRLKKNQIDLGKKI